MKAKKKRDYSAIKKPFKYEIDITWSAEDGAWVVRIPELPGCATHGDTPEQAFKMAEEAIESYLEALIDTGQEIPVPLSEEKLSGDFMVRSNPTLHRKLKALAKSNRQPLNTFVVENLKKLVSG